MTTDTLVLLILIVLIAGALPAWPYSREWGYAPTGGLTIILIVLLAWVFWSGRPLFSTGDALRADAQAVGHDLKAAGREAAGTIRNAVQ